MKEDLDRKEGAVPPGIEIPGIPTRKLVNVRLNGLPLYAAPDPDNADRVTALPPVIRASFPLPACIG